MSKMKDTNLKGSTGSWPNANTSDKICYDINALKQMKEGPLSKNKPQTTSQLEAYDLMRKSPIPDYNFSLASIQRPKSDFLPPFVQDPFSKTANKDLRKDGKPNIFGGKSTMKIISPNTLSPLKTGTIRFSLREDVKLNQSDNAWVPSRFKNEKLSKEEQKTQELYKTFRGILNKLTPEKFEKLMEKIKTLEIDTQERLEGVIDLVFEKAIYEPKYSKAYAVMCSRLAKMRVPAKNTTNPEQYVLFRTLLISRCQSQFETKKVDENIVKLEDEISKCSDPAKKKELQSQLEEENRKVRMRSVGNVRFIGELYKLNMLTGKIIMFCLHNLVDKVQEEKLECLCKLLTTIGEQVEAEAKDQLNVVFKKMQDIVDKKGAVSSRVRFMLEDVIALRRRRWVARSVLDLQPQTMEQIQREADMQQRHIEIMNATPQRREGGGGGGAGSGGGRRRGDRRVPILHHELPRLSYSVDTNKLKAGITKVQSLNTTKLAPQNFGWMRGAGLRSPHAAVAPAPAPLSNKYSLLTDGDDAPASALGHASDSSSRLRSSVDERVRESLPAASTSTPATSQGSGLAREPVATASSAVDSSPHSKNEQKKSELKCEDPFELKKARVKSTIDQFLITSDAEEVGEELRRLYPPQQHASLVAEILNAALEKSLKETVKIAKLILELVNTKTLSETSVDAGLRDIMEFAPDIVIDVPKLYDYIACFVSAFIENEIFSLTKLYDMSASVISSQQGRLLLKSVVRLLVADRGEEFVSSRWRGSQLSLKQWMDKEQVESFIAENSLHFLTCNEIKDEVPAGHTNVSQTCSSPDKENHDETQEDNSDRNEGACADSAMTETELPNETRLERLDDVSSSQNSKRVQSDKSSRVPNVVTNKNTSLDIVEKDASDLDRDENLNFTEKRDSVRIEELDLRQNTDDPLGGTDTDADETNIIHIQNTALSQNDDATRYPDLNSDENFNKLERCNLTRSKGDEYAQKDEKILRGLENNNFGPSCSENLNEADSFSSESDAVEERNELCLEERLLALMEAGEPCDRVLQWLETRKSRRQNDKEVVARALTRALCRYGLAGSQRAPDELFDEVRLQRYQDLLRTFDAERQHGLDCVIGVQDLIQRKPQYHEALLSVLQYLLEEEIVPLDALRAYELFVNAQSLD